MHTLPLISTICQVALVLSATWPSQQARMEHMAGPRITKIVQFPNGTWLENIGARKNGNLLFVLIDRAEVWEVNPRTPTPKLVHHFHNATRTTGIAEVAPDVFAVIVGNLPKKAISGGSWALALLDLSSARPAVKIVAPTIPRAQFLNGLEFLPPNSVLVSDSSLGVVYRIDIHTGASKAVLNDNTMKPRVIPLGINGIHIRGGHLYYSNTARSLFARIPINRTGSATGPAETIYKGMDYFGADDFAISPDGKAAYATIQFTNSVFRIDLSKKKGNRQKIVKGGSSGAMVGPTSLVFSRLKGEEKTFYVSTNNGAIPFAAGILLGTPMAGGSLFSVTLP